MALYVVHVFFTIFYILRMFCHYIIVWICYDRFLALWYCHRFQQTQKPRVMWIRVIITGIASFLLHMMYLFNVKVRCQSNIEKDTYTQDCEAGWIILDCRHHIESKESWQIVKRFVWSILLFVIPMFLVLAFNSGIVVGLIRRRLHNTTSTTLARHQTYSTIYISLAMSFTFVATNLPIYIYHTLYPTNIKCNSGTFKEEIFLTIANLLKVGENLTHILFLFINQTFRSELKTLLHTTKRCLCNILVWMTHTGCPSRWLFLDANNTHLIAGNKDSFQLTHLTVSPPMEQPRQCTPAD